MSELIIIAGPQAAGKSTIIRRLTEEYPNFRSLSLRKKAPLLFPLQESRQIVVHKYALLGGIFMTTIHEEEVVACDLSRMDTVFGRAGDRVVYLDECNIFTIAHAEAHGMHNIAAHLEEYMMRLQRLRAKVVFIDVPPEESWLRRQPKYEERLVYFPRQQHATIMRRYRDYLKKLHPLLIAMYQRIELPKALVDGRLPEHVVARNVCRALAHLSTAFR